MNDPQMAQPCKQAELSVSLTRAADLIERIDDIEQRMGRMVVRLDGPQVVEDTGDAHAQIKVAPREGYIHELNRSLDRGYELANTIDRHLTKIEEAI